MPERRTQGTRRPGERCNIGGVMRSLPRALALGVLMAVLVPPVPAADEFLVVAHTSVLGASVRRDDLAGVFLRKVLRWGDRTPAVPVDQSGTSPVRRTFSESVLRMPVSTVLQYWQKQMFATPPLRPPAVKGSDAEVIAFVGSTPGAIGYVTLGARLSDQVKTLAVID